MSDLVVMAEDAAPLKKVTSAEIKMGIRTSFSSGYQTFFEVGNDTGTRVTRHADAVAIGIWPSTGHQVHGFEVKVSRTDFLNEMKDPAKSQAIFQYCHRWSLATPPGLVRVDELPPNWGLVTFDGKSLRTVKAAPLLTPEPMSPGFVAAIVRRAGEMDGDMLAAAELRGKQNAEAIHRSQVEVKAREFGAAQSREAKEAIEFRNAVREALGEEWMSAHNARDMAIAYRLVRQANIGGGWSSVSLLLEEIDRTSDTIRKALFEVTGTDIPKPKRRAA